MLLLEILVRLLCKFIFNIGVSFESDMLPRRDTSRKFFCKLPAGAGGLSKGYGGRLLNKVFSSIIYRREVWDVLRLWLYLLADNFWIYLIYLLNRSFIYWKSYSVYFISKSNWFKKSESSILIAFAVLGVNPICFELYLCRELASDLTKFVYTSSVNSI